MTCNKIGYCSREVSLCHDAVSGLDKCTYKNMYQDTLEEYL